MLDAIISDGPHKGLLLREAMSVGLLRKDGTDVKASDFKVREASSMTVTCKRCGRVRVVVDMAMPFAGKVWFCHRDVEGRRCWTINRCSSDS